MNIRKIFQIVEETYQEAGQPAATPLRKVAVVAILANRYAGQPYTADLRAHIEYGAELGKLLGERAVAALAPYTVASYGKGALIGTAGEQEHGIALLTSVFGDALRTAVGGGKAWISSLAKRAAPGTSIDVPLAHKDALYVRSHYDGMTVTVPDGPQAEEIAAICVVANRGRLNHRIGGPAADAIIGLDGLR